MKGINDFYNWPVLGAVLLFALNNWWLKYEYHNWFTGKLSDFLFCFFFPLYCSAILAELTGLSKVMRILLGALATLIPFIGMKVSPVFSQWVSNILSVLIQSVAGRDSVNTVDATDLIAVPMIIFAVLFTLRKDRKECHRL